MKGINPWTLRGVLFMNLLAVFIANQRPLALCYYVLYCFVC